jgi:hypothetical protein
MSRNFTNPSTPGTSLISTTNWFTVGNGATYSAWIFPESWGGSGNTGLNGGWIWSFFGGDTGVFVQESATGGGGKLKAVTQLDASHVSTSISVDSILQLNTWYYVTWTIVVTGGNVTNHIFVNGVEVSYASQTSALLVTLASQPIEIGHTVSAGVTDNRYGFNGYIDSVGLWQSILTPAQMVTASLYGGTLITDPTHLIGYWPCLGNTNPEPDLSGNNRPLNVNGATLEDSSPGQTGTIKQFYCNGIQIGSFGAQV